MGSLVPLGITIALALLLLGGCCSAGHDAGGSPSPDGGGVSAEGGSVEDGAPDGGGVSHEGGEEASTGSDAMADASSEGGPAPGGPRPLADFIGISSSTRGGDVGTSSAADRHDLLQTITQLGIHRVRVDFTWSNVEPKRGQWTFGGYDVFVQDANEAGVEILAILDYGAAWANPVAYAPGGDAYAPPDRLADFATFASTVAARYAPTIHAYEIWNEPNNGGHFWHAAKTAGSASTVDFAPRATSTGVYGDPGLFAHLTVAAADAIHALGLGPDAPQVAPGGSIFLAEPPVGGAGNSSGPDFMKAAFAADAHLGGALDAEALHAYGAYPPDSQPESESFEWGTTNVQMGTKLSQMRATFQAGGFAPGKPAWITEVGWPNRNGVDEGKQARWMIRAIVLGALNGADLVYLYDMYDSAPNTDTGAFDLVPEPYFGLLRADGSPKQSYQAIRRLVAELGSYHVTGRVKTNDPNGSVYVVRLVDGAGRRAWVVWDSLEAGSGYAWPLPPNTTCSSILGGACTTSGGSVSVDSTPVYVVEN